MTQIVSLIIAQPNTGKTTFILDRLEDVKACIVVPKEEHEMFTKEFQSYFDKLAAPTLVDERELEAHLKDTAFQTIVFLSFSVWDDNEPAHLDSLLALARFAIQKKISVWAALEVTSAEELRLLQAAVLKVAEICRTASFEEVAMECGAGLFFTFSAKEFCKT